MLFSNRYSQPGPEIPKNTPQKKGFPLFWDILTRDFWSLIGINMLYVIICLPIITIGPATIAFCKITCTLVKGTHLFAYTDFWTAFKENFKRGFLLSFVLLLVITDLFIVGTSVLTSGLVGVGLIVATAIGLFISFIIVSVCIYLIPLLGHTDLKAADLVKNSVTLALLGKWNTLFATAIIIGIYIAFVVYFPISGVFMITVGFIFLFMIGSFFAWPVIEKNMAYETSPLQQNIQE